MINNLLKNPFTIINLIYSNHDNHFFISIVNHCNDVVNSSNDQNNNNNTNSSLDDDIDDDYKPDDDDDNDDDDDDAQQRMSVSTTTTRYDSNKQSRTVHGLKLSVLTILVVSAVSVGTATYYYVRNSEQHKFYDTYQDDATKVAQSIYSGVITTFGALDVLATTSVTAAIAANATWPYVTVPYYANHAAKVLSMSVGFIVTTVTLLHNVSERIQWEQYSWDHRNTINETLHIMDNDPNYIGIVPWNITMEKSLQNDTDIVPYNESRMFAPLWQTYPIPVEGFTAFNWDWLTDEDTDSLLHTYYEQRALLGEPYILPDLSVQEEVVDSEFWARVYSGSISPDDNPMEPVSDVMYPIINELDRIQIINTTDGNNNNNDNNTIYNDTTSSRFNASSSEVVAVLAATFYWRDVMRNTLPTGKQGLIVVIANPCTASFTYQINGPHTKFLGRGDNHDTKYDSMRIHNSFFELDQYNTVRSKYTGVPLYEQYCPFTVTFYPSSDMEEQFTTNDPIIFATVAVMIFIFTSIVFMIYDTKVEHRQMLAVSTAERSNAVLSSLFPSNIRRKLLYESNNNQNKKINYSKTKKISATMDSSQHSQNNDNNSTHHNRADNLRTFLRRNSNQHQMDDNIRRSIVLHNDFVPSKPIADLYSNTTVFFADICGFTYWSSSRGPDHVFMLLESLYGEFDQIAKRKRVYKVETIGDSYVAVAGLPDPMKHHATTMVKFAEEILSVLGKVTDAISPTLGSDTADLRMRIGLNSGPTTAGVIRGEKSRFQLFGDTVNTASRMESTGQPGRIQCTAQTADLIRDAGKGHWLTKRSDPVNVKGKGAMETYWVKTSTSRRRTLDTVSLSNE